MEDAQCDAVDQAMTGRKVGSPAFGQPVTGETGNDTPAYHHDEQHYGGYADAGAVFSRALDMGLDMKRFEEDLMSPKTKAVVDADLAEGKSLGVTGTPGFFVNGRYLSGAKPFDEFAQVINAELAKRNIPVPAPAAVKKGG